MFFVWLFWHHERASGVMLCMLLDEIPPSSLSFFFRPTLPMFMFMFHAQLDDVMYFLESVVYQLLSLSYVEMDVFEDGPWVPFVRITLIANHFPRHEWSCGTV